MKTATDLHIPVLLTSILDRAAPVTGHWVDGTLGAGGYTRGLLDAGADHVTGIDRDPYAIDLARKWSGMSGVAFTGVQATFSDLADHVTDVDGVVLDLGVSSMQLDQADRGFSFQKDGPLDMRMGGSDLTAADIVNQATEKQIADILYHYGEERASRRIAKAIVKARVDTPFTRTLQLADLVESQLPRPKPGQSHPATRTFQALRIAVNDEYAELSAGLSAAETALRPGGILAVVTFHSVEDRMVKRFLQTRFGGQKGSRHLPELSDVAGSFDPITRKAVAADDAECAANPRARSAKLRMARRTTASAFPKDDKNLSMPQVQQG
ncbi:MAG: 16S rRNA (cytosine(1402)-N(4))-methyltransferase RsmH, partial [Pseudomonadota bacterium]